LTLLALGTSTTYVIDEIPGFDLVLDSLDAASQPARKKLRYIAKPDQQPGFFGGSDFNSDRINPGIFGMGFDALSAASSYNAIAPDRVEVPEHLVIGKTGTALPGCGHGDQQLRQHTAKLLALTVANRTQGALSFDFAITRYDRLKRKVENCFGGDTTRVFKEVRDYKSTLLLTDAADNVKFNIVNHAELGVEGLDVEQSLLHVLEPTFSANGAEVGGVRKRALGSPTHPLARRGAWRRRAGRGSSAPPLVLAPARVYSFMY
jgi:hypothetical protein